MKYIWIPAAFSVLAIFYTVLAFRGDHFAIIGLLSLCLIVSVLLGMFIWLQEATMRDFQNTIKWISKAGNMLAQRNRAPFN